MTELALTFLHKQFSGCPEKEAARAQARGGVGLVKRTKNTEARGSQGEDGCPATRGGHLRSPGLPGLPWKWGGGDTTSALWEEQRPRGKGWEAILRDEGPTRPSLPRQTCGRFVPDKLGPRSMVSWHKSIHCISSLPSCWSSNFWLL